MLVTLTASADAVGGVHVTIAPQTPGVYDIETSLGGQLVKVGGRVVLYEFDARSTLADGIETLGFSLGEKLVKLAIIEKPISSLSKLCIGVLELSIGQKFYQEQLDATLYYRIFNAKVTKTIFWLRFNVVKLRVYVVWSV